MKIGKSFAMILGCALLAACGGDRDEAAVENADANLMAENMTMPADNLVIDANNVTVVNGDDMNAAGDLNAATDLNATNATNTANGM